jgi:WD40 repeat protein
MRRCAFIALLLVWVLPCVAQKSQTKPTLSYIKDIQPLFKERCVVCHNQSTLKNLSLSGGLALDTYSALKAGLPGKPPLFVVGKSREGELVRRLEATSPTLLMPKGGPALSKAQIARVKQWIDAGAPSGDISKENKPTATSVEPMPVLAGLQSIVFKTRITPPKDLLTKTTPPNSLLNLALPVGPLPLLSALAFSPDGKWLVVGTYRMVTLWDTTTWQPAPPLALPISVQSVAFRPDGQVLAIGGGTVGVSGSVLLYDMNSKKPLPLTLGGHTDIVYSVAWSRDGKLLATGSHDKTARLWNATTGKEMQVLKEHSDAVTRVCFAPDGNSLYTTSLDKTLRRFGVGDGKLIRAFSGHNDAIYALALSPDGKGLISSGIEPRLRWWNPDDGNTTRYSDGSSGQVNEVLFSVDGKRMVSADAGGNVRLWDAGSGGQQRALEGAGEWLYAVAMSADGKWVAGGGADGVVRLWQSDNAALRLSLVCGYPSEKGFEWLAVTAEGYYQASSAWDTKTRFRLLEANLNAPLQTALHSGLKRPEIVQKSLIAPAPEPFKIPEVAPPKPSPSK